MQGESRPVGQTGPCIYGPIALRETASYGESLDTRSYLTATCGPLSIGWRNKRSHEITRLDRSPAAVPAEEVTVSDRKASARVRRSPGCLCALVRLGVAGRVALHSQSTRSQ